MRFLLLEVPKVADTVNDDTNVKVGALYTTKRLRPTQVADYMLSEEEIA